MSARTARPNKARPGTGELLRLYTTMLRIRRVEETLMEVFAGGGIPGFLHVSIGQEAAPAAVCSLLDREDCIATTHRGHGHVLAKGIDLDRFMAEIFGKKNGYCLGRSGSMHLADRTRGILGANGIVGGGIPIATGAALALQRQHPDRIVVCFFGDGAVNQGTFHESLNMASLWKLPIVYVCENNGWAEFTPQAVHAAVTDVAERVSAYAMPAATVPNRVLKIRAAADAAVRRARAGHGPSLLEVKCNRWHGHFVGDAQRYRGEESVRRARADDCLAAFARDLLARKQASMGDLARAERTVRREIDAALAFARRSPAPDLAEVS